ncbi:MAG: FMN-binding negative transcriptional regulator [Proteobacteria bacterium]|nr:FMN-binding negative transcriptional regulator [Pseudomonadota bacterium]
MRWSVRIRWRQWSPVRAGPLAANHLPLLIDPEPAPHGTLRGHVARGNPLWRQMHEGGEVLAIFQGPQRYVTPSWYPSKRATGKVVPTWNYAVVHARGPLLVREDRVWLRDLVSRLTRQQEAGLPQPWGIADAPADYIEQMLGAIVGIEIPVARLQGKWKVSQNRVATDRIGVIDGLVACGDAQALAMADLVDGKRPV